MITPTLVTAIAGLVTAVTALIAAIRSSGRANEKVFFLSNRVDTHNERLKSLERRPDLPPPPPSIIK